MERFPDRFEIAARVRLSAVEVLAPRFFREVLGYDYDECLITDESDLADFTHAFDDHRAHLEEMLDLLESHYLIDARAAGSTRIVDLLEFLYARGVRS